MGDAVSNHKTKYVRYGDEFRAECSCRQNSKLGTRQEAEDWLFKHREQVQRARAHLRHRIPSITQQYNYYRQQEQNPHQGESDRRLWKQLADELEPRLPSDATDDVTLW
jgi:hypothetical protein